MHIAVYMGSSLGTDNEYKKAAQELGTWIGESHHTLVYGAGQTGLMGVVADAVLDAHGHVYSVIPFFLAKTELIHHEIDELHEVKTMAERKTMMKEKADAFIALPGGLGTLEEISEIMSDIRLHLIDAPCIILNIHHFYDALQKQCEDMVKYGFVDQRSMNKITFVETVDEIKEILK